MNPRKDLKVLIADDEPSILMSLEFLFKKEGYKVLIARDGKEAIEMFDKEQPSILILDIMMPNVDGYSVCAHAKTKYKDRKPKVVFLSAKNKESEIEQGYILGADLYIPKPFSTRELIKKVNLISTDIN
ncbi:response regulator transcription factor [Lacihabitans lacunae]|jgi:DNA-binding response OmpR family regulator|uniref:Response regulator transcription factor n=1 Tax=Lacihabitans lacunae TaxID=1028214 RepID=A0ABV7Z020_9BACT